MNLTNHFLVAMPGIKDYYFKNSVVYICEHSANGAIGLIINAPINITIAGILEQTNTQAHFNMNNLNKPVLNGGPISENRGFIIHQPKDDYESSIQMTDKISVTTSKDILSVLGTEAEPNNYVIALGYSGWRSGQLENELVKNSWLTIEADPDVIFNTPIRERWRKAIQILGIDAKQLSTQTGRA
ncbi:hypothetical protein CF67_09023 [Candidatus Photodesmus blepharus]|uniref:UPF0301 protein CF67_09023 n=1 Tax=Candidatus Photodesmus blepharonis TaxID=1179155 RepID=A0A084CM82_9GAMM|nr:YqgE/AlgH family protein [Candidatus Photodesmus blepharus]KEY90911.1 hypothetical protein CF67_09023 [Candidatus Photodesmus blepharus]